MENKKTFLEKWRRAADAFEIPKEAYKVSIKLVEDPSGNSGYSFAAIFNPHRYQRRVSYIKDSCPLCNTIAEARKDKDKNIFPEYSDLFVITPNLFPLTEGASIAISRQHREMYSTRYISKLKEELDTIFKLSKELGVAAEHNSAGAGASILDHEHWHLIYREAIFQQIGTTYGFEAVYCQPTKTTNKVSIMSDFPFAHLIFNENDTEHIVYFLNKLEERIGSRFPNKEVPHGIAQGGNGILVIPCKNFREKGIGAGDMTGKMLFCSQEEFDNLTYKRCIRRLEERLFKEHELNLEQFL